MFYAKLPIMANLKSLVLLDNADLKSKSDVTFYSKETTGEKLPKLDKVVRILEDSVKQRILVPTVKWPNVEMNLHHKAKGFNLNSKLYHRLGD